jgi:AcrR family transcriptional regulator
MSKGLQTREAILDEALRQATRVGLEGLSLSPLADSLNLSKSGLFAHFKSKEALQVEVVEEAIQRFKAQVLAPAAAETDPGHHLRALFERYLTWIQGTPRDGGCLFMTIAQEFDDRPGRVRDLLASSQRDWQTYLAGLVRRGQDAGVFRRGVDPDQVAFEVTGAAFAFQHRVKLLDDPAARTRAMAALDHILDHLRS